MVQFGEHYFFNTRLFSDATLCFLVNIDETLNDFYVF